MEWSDFKKIIFTWNETFDTNVSLRVMIKKLKQIFKLLQESSYFKTE